MIIMEAGDLRRAMEACAPYVVMTLCQLSPAVFLAVLKVALDPSRRGLSATVLVLYMQIISALLSTLALLFERKKMPKITFRTLCNAFTIAILQIPLGQLLLTASLRYITVTCESVAMNAIPVLVFLLAVVSGRERLHGQAKLLGILITSAAGATVMVFSSDSGDKEESTASGGQMIGWMMVGIAVIAGASSYILVGIIAGGIGSCAVNWCNHKKGPAFVSAFYPILIIFSFLIETLVLRRPAHQLESMVGVVLVTGGLYIFFWEKSKDLKAHEYIEGDQSDHHVQGFIKEPLLQNKVNIVVV